MIDELLDKIRKNCIVLSAKHFQNYTYYKKISNVFKIPVIVLSVFSGSFTVGSNVFLHQELISITSCIISMIITILSSIELYMRIIDNCEINKELSIKYKVLSLDIFKTLSLNDTERGVDNLQYLNKVYASYIKLVETSDILELNTKQDNLIKINYSDTSSNCSSVLSTENVINTDEYNL